MAIRVPGHYFQNHIHHLRLVPLRFTIHLCWAKEGLTGGGGKSLLTKFNNSRTPEVSLFF
jgi:hypothetical protein